MIAIFTLLLVLIISILVTRIATIALMHTGLSRQSARFQARSAFTGTGFTTSEAEMVVNHPIRRRIVMVLMLLGNVGIVTVVSSLILTFVGDERSTFSMTTKMLILVTGIALLWGISSSKWVDRHLSRIIERALNRYTQLDIKDYSSLLHLAGEYRVVELHVEPDDWLAENSIEDLGLKAEGLLVLGIERSNGQFIGAPSGETVFKAGDNVTIYGRTSTLAELDQRERGYTGDKQHAREIAKQQRVQEAEQQDNEEGGDDK